MAMTGDFTGVRIVAVIPTFNEFSELRQVIDSLNTQAIKLTAIIVVNAGTALPVDIANDVQEIQVEPKNYWTACVNIGLDASLSHDPEYVFLTNADTYALPGTIEALLRVCGGGKNTVACSPAYIKNSKGIQLLYSHQDPMGFLLYGRLIRPWIQLSDAPKDNFPIVLTGGQGVLLPRSAVDEFRMDVIQFPQYASDHDLWLTMREKSWQLILSPMAGVVNLRTLSENRATGLIAKIKKLWWRMSSNMAPESLIVMWRLRRKHLNLPTALISTAISFLLRWTIGLPKILRRT